MAKKNLTITIVMSELLYDIENTTSLTGIARRDGTNFEEVAGMQVNADEENLNQIMRSIKKAMSDMKVQLSEWIDEAGTTSNNILQENKDIKVTLTLPSNYDEAANDAIAENIHEYLSSTAIAEWFQITNKNDAKDYFDNAAACIVAIRMAINSRKRPVRPEPSEV